MYSSICIRGSSVDLPRSAPVCVGVSAFLSLSTLFNLKFTIFSITLQTHDVSEIGR